MTRSAKEVMNPRHAVVLALVTPFMLGSGIVSASSAGWARVWGIAQIVLAACIVYVVVIDLITRRRIRMTR